MLRACFRVILFLCLLLLCLLLCLSYASLRLGLALRRDVKLVIGILVLDVTVFIEAHSGWFCRPKLRGCRRLPHPWRRFARELIEELAEFTSQARRLGRSILEDGKFVHDER